MTTLSINSIALDIQGDGISAALREIFHQNQGPGFRIEQLAGNGQWAADNAKPQAVSCRIHPSSLPINLNLSFIPHPSSFCQRSQASGFRPLRGFTLFEVLLTLCLLAVIAAIIWPNLEKTFRNQRLRKAADQIQTQWCKARIKSMSTGCLLVFRYEIDGGKYRLDAVTLDGAYVAVDQTSSSPASTYNAETNSADSTSNSQNNQNNTAAAATSSALDKTLPEGITFVGSESVVDSRAAMTINNISSAEAGWSEPIFFYPDGTTSTARLILRNKEYRAIELFLRGFTGVVKISDVTTLDEAAVQ
jgi:prepilin-type N-terminal cleavage/methylation domain-containing protein